MPKKGRELTDEIRWGIEVANGMGLDYDEDDYWEDEDKDEGPSPEEIRAQEILDDAEDITTPEGAEEAEAQELDDAIEAIRTALNVDYPDDPTIKTAEGLLTAAQALADKIGKAAEARAGVHAKIVEDFTPLKEVKGAIKPHETRLAPLRQKASDALAPPITEARNDLARKAVTALDTEIKACTQEMEDLGGAEGLDKICKAFGVDEETFEQLDGAFGTRAAFLKAVKDFGSAEALAKMGKDFGEGVAGVTAMAEMMTAMGGAATLTKAAKDIGGGARLAAMAKKGKLTPQATAKLCGDLGAGFIGALMGKGDDPAAAIALQTEFGGDLKAFDDLVKEAGFDTRPETLATLLTEGCKGKAADFKTLCKTFATPEERAALKGVIDTGGLGDAPKALGSLLAEGCKGDPKMLKAFAAGFDTDEAHAGLSRLMKDAGLDGKTDKIDEAGLGSLFKDLAGEQPKGVTDEEFAKTRAKALADLAKGLDQGTCAKLKTVMTDGGLGKDPEVLGALLGPGCGKGNPAKVKGLLDKLAADAPGMKGLDDLLKKGGLGTKDDAGVKTETKASALAQVLDPGCGGDPDKLLTLVKGLDDTDRTNLKDIMAKGLGKAPKALGELVNTGCDAKPGALKDVIAGFDTKAKREGLGRLLEEGGLKAEDDKIGAKTLGAMFKHVGGEKPNGVSDDAFQKTRAKALADLAETLDAGDCAKLKTTLEKGGLGTEPDVFGQLLGIGCKGGNGVKVKALVGGLAADDVGMKGLNDLLKKGGFGAKDDADKDTNINTKCLAHLFEPGCNGDPAEILKLVKELDDTARTNLKGLMTEADLGKHPTVLGKMYENGCLTDPNGAHDGGKNPKILKDMIGEFSGTAGQRVFKDMMDKSGMTTPGKEDRLGSVLRHAFTDPRGAGVQEGKTLRKLADAFDGNFGDLETMFEAMEGAPDDILEISQPGEPNQPGKGLRNIIHAPKFGGDPKGAKDLRTDFFVPCQTRLGALPTKKEGKWKKTPKLTDLKQFLMIAASFEHEPCNASVTVPPSNIEFDMDHAAGRHSRKHGVFHLNKSPQMGTTLFPRQVGEPEIINMVSSAMTGGNPQRVSQGPDGPDRPPAQQPPIKKRTPPQDQYDLDDAQTFLPTDCDDGTDQTRLGFAPKGAGVFIKQFYPKSSTVPLQTLNTNDFIAMNNALTNNTKASI